MGRNDTDGTLQPGRAQVSCDLPHAPPSLRCFPSLLTMPTVYHGPQAFWTALLPLPSMLSSSA